MSRVLYVDPVGGAAGDMLLAALIDAGAPERAIVHAIEDVLPGRVAIATEEVRRAGLRAVALRVEPQPGEPEPVARRFARLDDSGIVPEAVRVTTRLVLARLDEAEAKAHGRAAGDTSSHALRDEDTWVDVIGIAVALHALGAERIVVGTLPLGGSGATVPGLPGHGDLPLPAPATLELLRGFAVRGAGGAETVTPTAAAVFAALGERGESVPEMVLDAVGSGAGTRDTVVPNVVRVFLGTPTTAFPRTRPLTVLESNLDDLTPELVADAADALFAAGALDVWTTPSQMKKGRSGIVLSALCDASTETSVRRAFFEATSTFGVRAHRVDRTELERRSVAVEVAGGTVRIKVGILEGRVVSATPEHDDVAAVAAQAGRPVREVYEAAVASAADLRRQEAPRP